MRKISDHNRNVARLRLAGHLGSVVALVVIASALIAAIGCSSDGDDPATPLATVEWRGGLCLYGECTTTLELDSRGDYVITQGDGVTIAESVDRTLVAQLAAAVLDADFDALRVSDYTDTCPTAFDGQEVRYTFHSRAGDERLSTCEHVLALELSPLRELLAIVDQLKPLDTHGATSTPTASPQSGSGGVLSDGEYFVFVRGLEDGMLIVDPAEVLTGEAAILAARQDGVIGADEALPNDVYIRNETEERLLVAPAPDVIVVLFGFSGTGALTETTISYDEFSALLLGNASADAYYGFIPGQLAATATVRDRVLMHLDQFYLP
jgi:hypothetical protein